MTTSTFRRRDEKGKAHATNSDPQDANKTSESQSSLPGDPSGRPEAGFWVIYDRSTLNAEFRPDPSSTIDTHACKMCSQNIAWTREDIAIAHLREDHFGGDRVPEEVVQRYVFPLKVVAREIRRVEYRHVLRLCREAVARIVRRRIRGIQTGLVSGGVFQQPDGIPASLLAAFEIFSVFIYAVPYMLQEVHADVYRRFQLGYQDETLERNNLILGQIAQLVEDRVADAELDILDYKSSETATDGLTYGVLVGAPYVLAQMIGNVLNEPIHGQQSILDLYESYRDDKVGEAESLLAFLGTGSGREYPMAAC